MGLTPIKPPRCAPKAEEHRRSWKCRFCGTMDVVGPACPNCAASRPDEPEESPEEGYRKSMGILREAFRAGVIMTELYQQSINEMRSIYGFK
jgi:hypothetical protein